MPIIIKSGSYLRASLLAFYLGMALTIVLAAPRSANAQHAITAPSAELPFELVGEHLIVSMKVDGSDELVEFVFDTGASATVLDTNVAKRMKIKPDYKQPAMGAAGVKEYDLALGHQVNVNEKVSVKNTPLVLVDLELLSQGLGRPIGGITGCDFLRKYIVAINHSQGKILFYEQDANIDTNGYAKEKLAFMDMGQLAHVQATIEIQNGEKFTGQLMFDTGAGFAISTNTPFSKKNNLLTKSGPSYQSSGKGLTTTTKYNVVKLKSASIGEHQLGEMELELSNATAGASARSTVMGILGNQILKRFDMIINFKKRTLHLRPNHLFDSKFKFRLSGIGLILKGNEVWIESVVSGSNAGRAGVKGGERLVSVDGKPTKEVHTVRKWLLAEGQTVALEVESETGELRTITLRLEQLFRDTSSSNK